jgi:hypothetical protein
MQKEVCNAAKPQPKERGPLSPRSGGVLVGTRGLGGPRSGGTRRCDARLGPLHHILTGPSATRSPSWREGRVRGRTGGPCSGTVHPACESKQAGCLFHCQCSFSCTDVRAVGLGGKPCGHPNRRVCSWHTERNGSELRSLQRPGRNKAQAARCEDLAERGCMRSISRRGWGEATDEPARPSSVAALRRVDEDARPTVAKHCGWSFRHIRAPWMSRSVVECGAPAPLWLGQSHAPRPAGNHSHPSMATCRQLNFEDEL